MEMIFDGIDIYYHQQETGLTHENRWTNISLSALLQCIFMDYMTPTPTAFCPLCMDKISYFTMNFMMLWLEIWIWYLHSIFKNSILGLFYFRFVWEDQKRKRKNWSIFTELAVFLFYQRNNILMTFPFQSQVHFYTEQKLIRTWNG